MARPFGAAFHASGGILVGSNRDRGPSALDVRSSQWLPVPEARGFGRVAVNPAGTRAALFTGANLQVWDVATGRLLNRLDWDASELTAPDEQGDRRTIHKEVVHLRPPAF